MSAKEQAEKLKKAFAEFDTDGSGALTHEELKAALTRPGGGTPMSDEDVAELIREFDANGDGVIQVEEFVAMMTGWIEPAFAWYTSIDKAPPHRAAMPHLRAEVCLQNVVILSGRS